jgi:FKBP-type peptidyl-prolyl cis-trans isomerase
MTIMKKLKQILTIACVLCCFTLTLKAQNDLADKVTYDREMLKNEKHFSGVIETPSGLMYQVMVMGTGIKPKPSSIVKLRYKLENYDFKFIEDHTGKPWEGRLDDAMAGIREALKMMPAGSKWQLWMPARLCVDKKGKVGGGRALITVVELLSVK